MRDSTIFVCLFGSFARHEHLRGVELDQDPYAALVNRAAVLGWNSTLASDGRTPDLWAMNDAAPTWHESTPDQPDDVVWFQVSVDPQRSGRRPGLPVPQLLTCALDATARTGVLGMTGVQVLAPMHLAGAGTDQLYAAGQAFLDPPAGPTARVRITVDSGASWEAVKARTGLGAELPRLADPLASSVRPLGGTFPIQSPTPVRPVFHPGTGRQSSFEVEVREWSPDSVVFLVAATVEAARVAGIRSSVVIDIAEEPPPDVSRSV